MPPINKLILGTVQFGLVYGINNRFGKPSFETVCRILDEAYAAGIYTLDTATAYGDALDVIGNYHRQSSNRFSLINKLQAQADDVTISDLLKVGLEKLHIEQFEAYLFHNYADYVSKPTAVERLREEKQKGLLKKIGVSIYTNEEFEFLLRENQVDLIQLPYNVLDNNNWRGDLIRQAKAQGITIHTRSVFLQGLFFKPIDELPGFLQPLRNDLQQLQEIAKEENLSVAAMALAYVLHSEAIDGVLIGVDSLEQLQENLSQANVRLSTTAIEKLNGMVVQEKKLLNPVNWK